MISASTSPGRRVTPTCVVPGSTASCAFGRSSNISTTSGSGEKSRSPKISRVGACSDRSSSVHPGTRAPWSTSWPRTRRSARIGSDRVVGVAHRLEVGRRRHAVVVEWRALPARRAVGIRRGDDQLADPGGRAERDRVRDETAEAETEQIGLGDPQMVEQRDDVTGQRLDRHRAVGVGGVPVALELHRDHLPARRKGFEQRPEIEVDGHQATVEQHKWPAGAVRLVVELQAVHRCVRHAGYDGARPAYSSRSAAARRRGAATRGPPAAGITCARPGTARGARSPHARRPRYRR